MLKKISDREYFAQGALQGVFSASLAKTLRKCPEKVFKREFPTDAQSFGSAFHCRILEPNQFGLRYYCALKKPPVPKNETKKEGDLRKAAWKLEVEDWEANNEGKIAISESDMDTIERMAFSLEMRPQVTDLLDQCQKFEISSWWTCSATGVQCKAKADGLGNGLVLDLKTALSAEEYAFKKACRAFGYYYSVAHYLDSPDFADRDYKFLVVEKSEPFCCAIYDIHPDTLHGVRRELLTLREQFKHYHETQIFPGYPGGTIKDEIFCSDEDTESAE
jgi:hypothetical protein